jgi:hypothetical protein
VCSSDLDNQTNVAVDRAKTITDQRYQRLIEMTHLEWYWKFISALTSLDWLFVKTLVIFASSLEKNMVTFLTSTFQYLKSSPTDSLQKLATEDFARSIPVYIPF